MRDLYVSLTQVFLDEVVGGALVGCGGVGIVSGELGEVLVWFGMAEVPAGRFSGGDEAFEEAGALVFPVNSRGISN